MSATQLNTINKGLKMKDNLKTTDLGIISNEKLEKIAEELKNIGRIQEIVENDIYSMFDDIEKVCNEETPFSSDLGIFNPVEFQIVENIQITLDNMSDIIKSQNNIIKILCENKGVILKNEVSPEIDTSKENNMIKSEQDSFTLYLVTYECDSADGAFSDYAIYNDPAEVSSFADNTSYYQFPKAVIICEVPYSNGAAYIDVHSNSLHQMDEDLDKDNFYEEVDYYSHQVDTDIDRVYTFEMRGGEQGFVYELSISIDKKYILEAFVTRVIERLKESEIDIISEENEWLQMYIDSKTISLSGERHLVSANSFDGETLHVSISDSGIAEELETICKSKNIKLINE